MLVSASASRRLNAGTSEAIAAPVSSSGRCESSSSEQTWSLMTAIRSNSSTIRIPYGAPATSASSWVDRRRPSSSAARVRLTSRPVISTAIALDPRNRRVAWPSTQTQLPSLARRRTSISGVRGSSGPAAASAARRLGTSSGCVSARHRRPITSSWRSPSAALKDGLAYSIRPPESNIQTRSGESSTKVAMRAASRALASASVICV